MRRRVTRHENAPLAAADESNRRNPDTSCRRRWIAVAPLTKKNTVLYCRSPCSTDKAKERVKGLVS